MFFICYILQKEKILCILYSILMEKLFNNKNLGLSFNNAHASTILKNI